MAYLRLNLAHDTDLDLFPSPPQTPGLVAPRDLSFSEVTSRSFRTTWEIDAKDVQSYLIQYRPEAEANADYISVSVPGEDLSSLLLHLTPLTKYVVNVYAQYEKGESFPLTGYETTLEGQ